jgi:hypothetical protein
MSKTTLNPEPENDAATPGDGSMSETMTANVLPRSHGVFKPVGHLMVGLPTREQSLALVKTLHDAGWPPESVLRFKRGDVIKELQLMVDDAGLMAGFGSEITLLRRFLALSHEGYRWVLVKVDNLESAQSVAEMARRHDATQAVYYRTLMIEELL